MDCWGNCGNESTVTSEVTTPTQDATPKTEPEPEGRAGEEEFSFETVQVNAQGEIIERVTKKAWQFVEDLGNGVMLEMVRIPTGSFLIGSSKNTLERNSDESPQHLVEITEEFYLGKFLVTQAQWQQITGNNPSSFKNGDKYPTETISWNDCQEFLAKLNNKAGKTYRLPSDAEWEYACRAGTQTPFYFGETISTEVANYDGTNTYGSGQKGVYREKTTEVGSFPANGFGLYDMHGNLREWCEDDWQYNYNTKRLQVAYKDATAKFKFLRGGSWGSIPNGCRSAYRFWVNATIRSHSFGFRVACFVSRSL